MYLDKHFQNGIRALVDAHQVGRVALPLAKDVGGFPYYLVPPYPFAIFKSKISVPRQKS